MNQFNELNNLELIEINGGKAAQVFKIVGGVATIAGSVIGGVASGGACAVPATMGVIFGVQMIGDALND